MSGLERRTTIIVPICFFRRECPALLAIAWSTWWTFVSVDTALYRNIEVDVRAVKPTLIILTRGRALGSGDRHLDSSPTTPIDVCVEFFQLELYSLARYVVDVFCAFRKCDIIDITSIVSWVLLPSCYP